MCCLGIESTWLCYRLTVAVDCMQLVRTGLQASVFNDVAAPVC